MKRKWLSLLLLTCLLTGCSKETVQIADPGSDNSSSTTNPSTQTNTASSDSPDTSSNDSTPTGRYISESIDFPEEITQDSSLDNFCFSQTSSTGCFDVYAFDSSASNIYQLTYAYDTGWITTKLDWRDSISLSDDGWLQDITTGADGNIYLLYLCTSDLGNLLPHVICQCSDSSYEEIPIKDFQETKGKTEYPYLMSVDVDEEGILYFCDSSSCSSYKDGEKLFNIALDCDLPSCMVTKESLYLNDRNNASINCYNKLNGTVDTSSNYSTTEPYSSLYCMDDHGQLCLTIPEGIYTLQPNTTTWEQIVDNQITPIPTNSIGFTTGNNDDYYIVSMDHTVTHYYYSDEVSSLPADTISIYSLANDDLLRQAINKFQTDHPDIQVTFRAATDASYLCELEDVDPSDYITSLNTELLSGGGCDILILDDLPYETYSQKGILANLYDYVPDLRDSDLILPTILSSSEQDGCLYALPTLMYLYTLSGTTEAMNSLTSVHDVLSYMTSSGNNSLFTTWNISSFVPLILQLESDRLMDPDQLMSEEDMITLFEDLRTIQSQTIDGLDELTYTKDGIYSVDSQLNQEYEHPETLIGQQLSGISSAFCFSDVCAKRGTDLTTIKNQYDPALIVGINQSSSQKEMAGELISYLLQENVQTLHNNCEAFSILSSCLDEMVEFNDPDVCIGTNDYTFFYPEKTVRQSLANLCTSADNIRANDISLYPLYTEAFTDFLTGTDDAATAAKQLYNKVSLYLSES